MTDAELAFDRLLTSYHEAGHFVAAALLGDPVDEISVVGDDSASGWVQREGRHNDLALAALWRVPSGTDGRLDASHETYREMVDHVRCVVFSLLAGRIAEAKYWREIVSKAHPDLAEKEVAEEVESRLRRGHAVSTDQAHANNYLDILGQDKLTQEQTCVEIREMVTKVFDNPRVWGSLELVAKFMFHAQMLPSSNTHALWNSVRADLECGTINRVEDLVLLYGNSADNQPNTEHAP